MSQTEVQLIKDSAVVTADIADQAVTLDKLPHGTSSNDGKFLRANNGADPTFETVTGTTINNNADNRVITGSGTANTLNGESGLTYDGSNLSVTGGLDVSSDVSIADVIKHTGDTNTKIRFPAADTVSIETGGNERLRVDSSGRVMIGTTTEGNGDGDEFTIANVSGANMGMTIRSGTGALGNIFFSDATSGNAEFAGFLQYGHNDNSLRFGTDETTRVKIDSTGRISAGKHGIGTHNDASEYLKVQSDDTAANISIVGSNATHSTLNMGDEDDFNIQKIKSDHTDNSLGFFTSDLERFRVDSSGRLLLGTTSYKSNLNASADASGQVAQFIHTGDNINGCLSVFAYSESTSPTTRGAKLQLHRARSSDGSTNTTLSNGDLIGSVEFKGNDGTSFTAAARIDVMVDGGTGTDDMPGRIQFHTSADGSGAPTERMRIDSSGHVGVATSTADQVLAVKASNSNTPRIGITNPDFAENFNISSYHDSNGIYVGKGANAKYNSSANLAVDTTTHKSALIELDGRNNGAVVFYTGSTGGIPSERMRISQGGAVTFNATGDVGGGQTGTRIQDPEIGTCRFAVTTTSSDTHIQFLNNNANNVVGSVTTVSNSTAYNTSSDYRLKENVSAISDGITRLKTLKPYRFNFKVEPDKTVDGFFAHEVTAVPEAITGEKDAVAVQADVDKGISDKVGDPIYQQIDQSKLVPLLTAALQEAIAKIETLETKVAALEAA